MNKMADATNHRVQLRWRILIELCYVSKVTCFLGSLWRPDFLYWRSACWGHWAVPPAGVRCNCTLNERAYRMDVQVLPKARPNAMEGAERRRCARFWRCWERKRTSWVGNAGFWRGYHVIICFWCSLFHMFRLLCLFYPVCFCWCCRLGSVSLSRHVQDWFCTPFLIVFSRVFPNPISTGMPRQSCYSQLFPALPGHTTNHAIIIPLAPPHRGNHSPLTYLRS